VHNMCEMFLKCTYMILCKKLSCKFKDAIPCEGNVLPIVFKNYG
jgi:hypothetical protein